MAASNVRKGKCLNIGECANANSKKIVEVDVADEFVCPLCKTELVIVKPDKPIPKSVIMAIIAVVVIGGGIGAYFALSDNTDKIEVSQVSEPINQVSIEEPLKAVEADEVASISEENDIVTVENGKPVFTYGKYTGEVVEGKAQGQGSFCFTKARRISKKDQKARMAEPGDYIDGEFFNNEPVNVKWYNRKGEQKGAIMVGRSN